MQVDRALPDLGHRGHVLHRHLSVAVPCVRDRVEARKRLDSSVDASRLGQADTTSGELAFGMASK
jgi:hypothetical protein